MMGPGWPAVATREFLAARRERHVEHGCQLSGLEVQELAVETVEHVAWRSRFERIGAERAAQSPHDHRRWKARAGDVAHDEPDVAVREVEHVVPVAAESGGRCRDEASRDLDPLHGGWCCRYQTALKGSCSGAVGEGAFGVQRVGELVTDFLEPGEVDGIEVPRRERADVQDADEHLAGQQRNTGHRAHASRPDQGVHDRAGSYLVQCHRAPGRGNGACEPGADRQVEPLSHLLLQPPRRHGEEVRPRRVDDEHHGGIDAQPHQHVVKELLEPALLCESRELRRVDRDVAASQFRRRSRSKPNLAIRCSQPHVKRGHRRVLRTAHRLVVVTAASRPPPESDTGRTASVPGVGREFVGRRAPERRQVARPARHRGT